MFCTKCKITDIQLIKNNSSIVDNNDNKQTLSIYLASNGIIPPKIFEHDKNIKDGNGKTVQDYLIDNNIDVPEQWQSIYKVAQKVQEFLYEYCQKYEIFKKIIIQNPEWQDNDDKYTFAMYLLLRNIIPPKQFIHNPNIKDSYSKTVREYLQDRHLPIPNEWYDDEYKKDHKYKPEYLNNALNGILTQKPDNIKPEQQYENEWTVAMIYAQQGIIPLSQWEHKSELTNDNKETVAMLLAQNEIFDIPIQWQHSPLLKNKYKQTVAMLLAENKMYNIPQCWYHDPEIQDIYEYTVAMNLAYKGIIPPNYWHHDSLIKNKYGWTVAMKLANSGIIPPKEWEHDSLIRDNQGCTVAMRLAGSGIIPPDYWYHDPLIIEQHGLTVAMLLAYNGIIPPKQFIHNPNIEERYTKKTVRCYLQNNQLPIPNEWYDNKYKKNHKYKPKCINDAFYGILTELDENIDPNQQYEKRWTVAMIYAQQGIIPPQCWNHDPNLQNCEGNTVAMLLIKNKIFNIPQQWQHKPELQNNKYNNDNQTIAMIYANEGITPPKEWQHKPELQNNTGNTVAMILASKGIIPPKEWKHNPHIANQDEKTVQDYLIEKGIKVPNQWQYVNKQIEMTDQIQQMLDQYCKKYFIENQQIIINYPQYQKYNSDTFAIYLEINNIEIPKEFQYDPEYRLFNSDTTAMSIASQGKIPSHYWYHDPQIQNNDGKTVAIYLAQNGIISPEQWQYNSIIQDDYGYTVSMYLAQNSIIPSQQWYHNPELQNNDKYTVAMLLVKNNIFNIPQYWQHDSLIKNIDQKTVAMIYIEKNIIPPQCWYHDPTIQDNEGYTVPMYLAKYNIIPPEQWEHDKNIINKYGFTVQDYLQSNNIKVPDQWKIIDYNCDIKDKGILKYLIDFCEFYNINKNIVIQNPEWQNNEYKQTFAMKLALEGIIPSKQFEHDPELKDNIENTVAFYLAFKNIIPPKQWQINPNIIQKNENNMNNTQNIYVRKTIVQQLVFEENIPYQKQNNDFLIQDDEKFTVGIYLANKKTVSPQKQQYDSKIKNKFNKTVEDYLKQNNKKVPQQWKIDQQLDNDQFINQMLQYYCEDYEINNQQTIINNPGYQKYYGINTFAMYLAFNGIIPSEQFIHKSDIQNSNGYTVALLLAQQGIVTPEQWQHNPELKDSKGMTVEDYLIKQNIKVPKFWQINYNDSTDDTDDTDTYTDDTSEYSEISNYSQSNQDFDQNVKQKKKNSKNDKKKNKNDRDQQLMDNIDLMLQQYKYQYQDDYEKLLDLVYQFCIKCKIMDIEVFKNTPTNVDNNDNKQTLSMYLASNGVIPPEIFEHQKDIKDGNGKTVQDYLIDNSIDVPKQWYIQQLSDEVQKYLDEYCEKYKIDQNTIMQNPSWQENEDKWTFAMQIVWYKKIIPPKQFEHDPRIQNIWGDTVAVYLEKNSIQVLEQWKYDPLYKLKWNCTTAMKIANYEVVPSTYWNHDPQLIDDYCKKTVAIHLAAKGIIPPKEWEHNPLLKDNLGKTVCDYLIQYNIEVPEQWETRKFDIEIENSLNQYCNKYKIDKQSIINDPSWQDYTYNETFAIFLASKGIIPPEQFKHNPVIVNIDKHNVEYFLNYNNKEIPEYWKVIDRQIAMTKQIQQQLQEYCLYYGIKNQQLIINNPEYQKNSQTLTFAMWLAARDIMPPKEFEHDSNIKYDYWTVAFYLADKGIDPPEQWHHDCLLKDDQGYTVGMTLAWKGKIPSEYWMHDVDIEFNGISIRSCLLDWGYIYKNKQFIRLTKDNVEQYVQTEILDDICQICLEKGEQEFIVTKCGHKTCLKCFKEIIEANKQQQQQQQQKLLCPVCRQERQFNFIQ